MVNRAGMYMKCFLHILMIIPVLLGWSPALLNAQYVLENPAELRGIDVEEHLGEKIPLNIRFINEDGNPVALAEYFHDEKPVMLVLAYYECPMLCTLVLNGITEGMRHLKLKPGRDFNVLTISIDPEETYDLAAAKKDRYLQALGQPDAVEGWNFFVGEEKQIRTVADALGFKYYYDEERDEYAHPAVVFLLTPDGEISRYLYGIEFTEKDLRLGLLEAAQGRIGSTLDRLILYCYHYDPDAEGYTLFAMNIMRVGGVLTLVIILLLIGSLISADRVKKMKLIKRDKHREVDASMNTEV